MSTDPELATAVRRLLADLERQGFGEVNAEINGGDVVEVMTDWYFVLRDMVQS